MATRPETEEVTVASHTLGYLCALDRKLDLIIETSQRHSERIGRVERDIAEMRQAFGRDITELKADIVSFENKVPTAHREMLNILHRLDERGQRNAGNGTP